MNINNIQEYISIFDKVLYTAWKEARLDRVEIQERQKAFSIWFEQTLNDRIQDELNNLQNLRTNTISNLEQIGTICINLSINNDDNDIYQQYKNLKEKFNSDEYSITYLCESSNALLQDVQLLFDKCALKISTIHDRLLQLSRDLDVSISYPTVDALPTPSIDMYVLLLFY